MSPQASERGYASATALLLCAVVSLFCAGTLGLTHAHIKAAQRDFFHAVQREAINTALIKTGISITRKEGEGTVTRTESIDTPSGPIVVTVRAEFEGRKWNLADVEAIDETKLAQYTSLSRSELAARMADVSWPGDDCVRTLLSRFGNNSPEKALPDGRGLISSGGHDGQVWRLRAVAGSEVEEQQIRFIGDPDHPFAVIASELNPITRNPPCRVLKNASQG